MPLRLLHDVTDETGTIDLRAGVEVDPTPQEML